MKILMLKDQKGSNDGFVVTNYEKGKEYTVCDDLAEVFVNQLKVAKKVTIKTTKPKK